MPEPPPQVIIELRPSTIQGVGVFAVTHLTKGRKVADGLSEEDYQYLVLWEDFQGFEKELQEKIKHFCVGTPEGFIPPDNFDFNKLSVEWYLNHSCMGNCGFNDDGDFVAITDVRRGTELTYDYGLVESNPNFLMRCACPSNNCRKVITGNDWRDEEFQRRNREFMLPRLRLPVPVLA
jgi:uncharacterized protein